MRSEVYSVALAGLTATIVRITVMLEPREPSPRFVEERGAFKNERERARARRARTAKKRR
jgi:hypothetical protein